MECGFGARVGMWVWIWGGIEERNGSWGVGLWSETLVLQGCDVGLSWGGVEVKNRLIGCDGNPVLSFLRSMSPAFRSMLFVPQSSVKRWNVDSPNTKGYANHECGSGFGILERKIAMVEREWTLGWKLRLKREQCGFGFGLGILEWKLRNTACHENCHGNPVPLLPLIHLVTLSLHALRSSVVS
jgi:hypothetical protein